MAVGTLTSPPLWGKAPPLPSNAFAHLTPPPANNGPISFPLEMPTIQRTDPMTLPAQYPPQPLPGVNNPWSPPGDPFHVSASTAVDTTQGLVLEGTGPAPRVRLSKVELAFWIFTVVVASTIVLHRNGVLGEWFASRGYALMQVQLLGKPSLETVAGVKSFLAETTPPVASANEP